MLTDKGLKEIIAEINAIYQGLSTLSNDQLRTDMQSIESAINLSEDKSVSLDKYLLKVYALIKETARRFSIGDISVTANESDVKFANEKTYDFISIKDGIAVYSNQWIVSGELFNWRMVHYDEQVLGGYLLHNGYATEMATGEGKTLVATLPILLNALTHNGVHIMTTNEYLSMRDYEMTRPLYMFYGLSVGNIERYSRTDFQHKKAYECDITFGTNSSFVFDYLFDHLEMESTKCVQRKLHNFAIIDELDSILVDEACTPHLISGGKFYDEGNLYSEKMPIVKELIELGADYYEVDNLRKQALFTDKGKHWLVDKTGIKDLFYAQKTNEIVGFDSMSQQQKTDILDKLTICNALFQLLNALTVYVKDVDYIIDRGEIVIIDQHTGRKKIGCRWEHGLHTALEVKEYLLTQHEHVAKATISIKNYYKLYNKVSGMSGTLSQVSDELWKQYGLKYYCVPTHKPMIRNDWPLVICKSEDEKNAAIVKQIQKNIKIGRPSLVGCKTIRHCEELSKLLDELDVPHNVLSAKTSETEAIMISQAGVGSTVTVSTNIAGRGTDIKLSTDALRNGGLMVIGCDLLDSLRVERQLRGRAGRQGDPGDSLFFVSSDEDVLQNLSKSDYQTLLDMSALNIEQEKALPYFLDAQKKQEERDSLIRKQTSRTDDTIAPFRKAYYDLREDVLFNTVPLESMILDVVQKVHGNFDTVEKHIQSVHENACAYLRRILRNDHQSPTIDIPCSDQTHLFIIEISRDRYQRLDYFRHELFRQTILQVYDKHWQSLMAYLLKGLDDDEISLLKKKHDDMQDEIDSIIYSRLIHSQVVFDEEKGSVTELIEEQSSGESDSKLESPKRSNYPLDGLCPCKSGKKYKDCHGLRLSRGRTRR